MENTIEHAKELLKHPKVDLVFLEQDMSNTNTRLQELSESGDYSSTEYTNLSKKSGQLQSSIDNIKSLEQLLKHLDEAKDLLSDNTMKEMAELEIQELTEKMNVILPQVEKLTAIVLKNDNLKAILEIRPGVGGVEASLFAEELNRSYIRYCNSQNMHIEQVSMEYDQEGGIKESIFIINNSEAYGKLRFESGVHRVQRVPVTESGGRIHTSSASIVILPQFDTKDIEVKDSDIRIDVYRSSGPGGQSVNTTDSAVRITHLPTNIVVTCQAGKSQHKNKEMAMSILMSKLQEIEEEKLSSEEKSLRESSIKSGDRSVKIRTYNFQQGRVTDHRISKSWFNLPEIMDGDGLGEVIEFVNGEMRKKRNNL